MIQTGKTIHTFTKIIDVCDYFTKNNYRLWRYKVDAKKHILQCEFEKMNCDSEVIPTQVITTHFTDNMQLLMKLTAFMSINNEENKNECN